MKKNKEVFGIIILFLCSFFWGTAFVAQKKASDILGAWTYNGCRFLVGALAILPVVIVMSILKKKHKQNETEEVEQEAKKENYKMVILGGLIIGTLLALASFFQQKGIETTTVGKAGFITGFYIVLVPIFSFFIFKQKYGVNVYIAVVLALVGLYLLSMKGGFSAIEIGDIYILICSLFYTFQILAADYFTKKANPIKLALFQMLFCGLISLVVGMIVERNTWEEIVSCVGPILYAGIMSCGVAYTFQLVGQKFVNSTVASLIMSLESTISAICSVVILKEYMSTQEICGCVAMFSAICISQIDFRLIFRKKKEKNEETKLEKSDN